MQRRTIFKSISYFTIFFFLWAVLWSSSFGNEKDPLAEAYEFYRSREYDKSISRLNEFIAVHADQDGEKKLLADAYYLLSKVYFELREDLKMEENLRRLFLLAPDFSKRESNPVFMQSLEKARKAPLVQANRFYGRAEYSSAISVLDEFIRQYQDSVEEVIRRQKAYAHYLLAKIYFDTRYEDQIDLNLRRALDAEPDFRVRESDPAFKFRLDRVRDEIGRQKRIVGEDIKKTEPLTGIGAQGENEEAGRIEAEKPDVVLKLAGGDKAKKKRKFPLLLAGGIAVVVGVLVWILISGKKTSGEMLGAISFASEPPGADIFLDGNKLSGITPYSQMRVSAGSHAVRLEHDLCRSWEGRVEVKADQMAHVSATLTRIIELAMVWTGFPSPAIATDKSGNVYLTGQQSDTIRKFSAMGMTLASWRIQTYNGNCSPIPLDVVVSAANHVYVALGSDCADIAQPFQVQRINKYSSTGALLVKWGSWGTGNSNFKWVTGVACDDYENIYALDSGNGRVKKFTANGTFLTQWPISGGEDICSDRANHIYVAEGSKFRIKKFTANGSLIAQWGSKGSGDTQFTPSGIVADSANNIYLADRANHRIMKFSSTGNYIWKWGSLGSGSYQFNEPTKLAMDDSGYIYVADKGNERILKFRIYGDDAATAKITYADDFVRTDLQGGFSKSKNRLGIYADGKRKREHGWTRNEQEKQ